jgi:hypothetical protein
VSQRGTFMGVAVESFKGRFNMLLGKMASLVRARAELAEPGSSTPRRFARVRGTALHYCCAIPLLAVAAPSLLQGLARYAQPGDRGGTGGGPLDGSGEVMKFDWDRESEHRRRWTSCVWPWSCTEAAAR